MGPPGIGRLTSGIGILHLFAPAWFGPTFVGIGVVGGILMPMSGFWLLLALGLYATWLGKASRDTRF